MRSLVFPAVAMLAVLDTPAICEEATSKPLEVEGPSFSLSSGVDYSSGKYGQPQSTDIVVGLTNLTVTTGSLQFGASMPYLNIVGPAYVVIGATGLPVVINPKAGTGGTERSGWGDLNLSATYTLPSGILDDFDLSLTGRTKIATANSAKGLTSGATDFAFSFDVSRQFDNWGPFVTFGYTVPGNPSFYAFNDAPSFSIGSSLQLNESFVVIASYDFDGSISSTLADAQQLFTSASWLLNDRWSFTVYAEKGLSSGAPQIGTGLLISWKLL
jgi:hypothetical protein